MSTLIYPIVSLSIALTFNAVGQEGEKVDELENTVITGLSASPDAFSPLTTKSLRFGDDLKNTPLTVQALSQEVIQEIQATGLSDVLTFSTGVVTTSGFGGTIDGANIRGFDATFAENGIVSGGPFAGRLNTTRDAASIERVEVLRGPNGALFGEGTLGGVINVVRKRPEAGTFLNTRSLGSSEGLFRQELDANTSFGVNDEFQLRFISSYENNENNFRDNLDSERLFYSLGFDYEASEDLKYSFHIERTESDVVFDRGIPIDLNGNLLADRDTNLTDPDVGDVTTESTRLSAQVEYDLNPDWKITGHLGFDETKLDGDSLTSITNFQEDIIIPLLGIEFIAGRDIVRGFSGRDFDSRLYTGRFDLKGKFDTGSISHETLLGLEYRRLEEDTITDSNNALANPATINLFDIVNNQIPGALDAPIGAVNGGTTIVSKIVTNNIAITAFDQITINSKLSVLLGGRVDFIDLDSVINQSSRDISEVAFSPTVGVNYKFNDLYSVYGRYSELQVESQSAPS